jgi:hypothetical protein
MTPFAAVLPKTKEHHRLFFANYSRFSCIILSMRMMPAGFPRKQQKCEEGLAKPGSNLGQDAETGASAQGTNTAFGVVCIKRM